MCVCPCRRRKTEGRPPLCLPEQRLSSEPHAGFEGRVLHLRKALPLRWSANASLKALPTKNAEHARSVQSCQNQRQRPRNLRKGEPRLEMHLDSNGCRHNHLQHLSRPRELRSEYCIPRTRCAPKLCHCRKMRASTQLLLELRSSHAKLMLGHQLYGDGEGQKIKQRAGRDEPSEKKEPASGAPRPSPPPRASAQSLSDSIPVLVRCTSPRLLSDTAEQRHATRVAVSPETTVSVTDESRAQNNLPFTGEQLPCRPGPSTPPSSCMPASRHARTRQMIAGLQYSPVSLRSSLHSLHRRRRKGETIHQERMAPSPSPCPPRQNRARQR